MAKTAGKRLRQHINIWIGKQKFARKAYAKKFDVIHQSLKKECSWNIHNCSILQWWRIGETGDLTLLLKEKREVSNPELNALRSYWRGIQNQQIKEFGWPEKTRERIELMRELVEKRCDMIINADNSLLTDIEIAEQRLDKLNKQEGDKANLAEICATLEKVIKVQIDIEKCSVWKHFGYIKMAEDLTSNSTDDGGE